MINPADILNARILIVDDHEANILLIERMLRGAGYVSITSTMNPNEVCELHRKNHYDLVLLDLLMPGMNGYQVMGGLKGIETDSYLPVLVITAHPDHKLRALKAGAKDFVSKPLDLAEVLARVHNLLEMRLLYEESRSHSKALEQKVQEVEASRELIRHQSDEIKRLYDKIVFREESDAAELVQPQVPREARLHTLLYIEDNPANMKLVEQIIVRHPDMRLLTAVNGIRGIDIARVSQPEVILMDINLPGFNGFEALKILRADPATAHIPVIAISASVMPRDIERGLEAGFFRYLTKPVKLDEFMEALDVALKFAEQKSANSK